MSKERIQLCHIHVTNPCATLTNPCYNLEKYMYQFLTSKGNAGSLALFRREESGDQEGNHQ